jgi:hypothetical protein
VINGHYCKYPSIVRNWHAINHISLPLPVPGIIIFDMSTLFPDTHPEAEALLIRLLRQAPPWRKLEMVEQLNQSVKLLALSGLRQRYPQDDEECLRRRLADLLLGEELAFKVYGPVPGEK